MVLLLYSLPIMLTTTIAKKNLNCDAKNVVICQIIGKLQIPNSPNSSVKKPKTFILIADKNFDLDVGSLVLFSNKVNKEFLRLNEQNKLYIQSLKWLGFKSTKVAVEHNERFEGESSYTLKTLVKLAIQGWVSNSEKLLYLSIKLGFIFTFFAILTILYVVYKSFTINYDAGWPSLVSIILLCTG